MTPYKLEVTAEKLDETFRSNYYSYLHSEEFEKTFLTRVGAQINLRGRSCLDVGCGEGWLSKFVNNNISYVGIEGSKVAVGRAAVKYPHRTFLVDRIDKYPFHCSGTFDTIVFGGILDVYIEPEQRIPFLESYLKFGPQHFIIYDLERLDHQPLSERFKLVHEEHHSVEMELQEVKKHRKILVYEC